MNVQTVIAPKRVAHVFNNVANVKVQSVSSQKTTS